ncbi:tetraspanin-19-like [Malania oleifera]|uniref:tetraspanin-19-like n=1 Tax=Malania oleifera TaxID=397392 RepID=UPI0025AE75EB|nr:tetraspanin-19-like [Malania oleifera]
MARGRTGCCLHSSLRTVNFIVNVFGVGMIVYSLWLLKKWKEGIAELPSMFSLPHPWFIYTCLGVGIVVCLSTLSGHMVANCISNSILCIYIVSIYSLLFIQIGVIVTIFFKIDWESQLTKYIDEHHEKFQRFIIFHLKMCRLIVLLVVVAQVNVGVPANILWAVGTEPRPRSDLPNPPALDQSFLVIPNSPLPVDLSQNNRKFDVSPGGNTPRSFLSQIHQFLRMQIQRRIVCT